MTTVDEPHIGGITASLAQSYAHEVDAAFPKRESVPVPMSRNRRWWTIERVL